MKDKTLRIATRKSPLALKQSEIVKHLLTYFYPDLSISILPFVTTGDKLQGQSLADSGGKGLFIKELEQALLNNQADIAVHSMKDMPVQLTAGLEITTFLKREDARDVLISPDYKTLSDLPQGSIIGTASLRRQGMVEFLRPDLEVRLLRGNVGTRLTRLSEGHFDAIILAAAGIHRLELSHHIRSYFSLTESIPSIGQGIIGIESIDNNQFIKALLRPLNDISTQICILAERSLSQALAGDCHSPIGGHAVIDKNDLTLYACVYDLKNHGCLKAKHTISLPNINDLSLIQPYLEKVAQSAAQDLLNQGALFILNT